MEDNRIGLVPSRERASYMRYVTEVGQASRARYETVFGSLDILRCIMFEFLHEVLIEEFP